MPSKSSWSRNGTLPLYRQIASRLQFEIVTGARERGSRLPSLRDAAGEWGVNLHTVRRAYKELEAAGLVEIAGAAGTRVASLAVDRGPRELDHFLGEIARAARRRFDLTPLELADRLRHDHGESRPADAMGESGILFECSRTLSEMLARQLEDRLSLPVVPRDLRTSSAPPGGLTFGTWFHRRELVERFRDREGDLHLLRIRPARSLFDELRRMRSDGELWSIVLVDRHPASGHDLTMEFQAQIESGVPIELRIPSDPVAGFAEPKPGTLVIATPQTWDELPTVIRTRDDVRLLRYEIDEADLERLAVNLRTSPG